MSSFLNNKKKMQEIFFKVLQAFYIGFFRFFEFTFFILLRTKNKLKIYIIIDYLAECQPLKNTFRQY